MRSVRFATIRSPGQTWRGRLGANRLQACAAAAPPARSQTWRTFLTNHTAALGSIDFFTVHTITGRVLFVFVVLLHHRRRVVHFNITEHPTVAWTAQQVIDAFPHDTAPGTWHAP